MKRLVSFAIAGALLFAGALLLAGCGEPHSSEPVVIDHALWVQSHSDPFEDHAPLNIACASSGYGPEGVGFEVRTGECEYLNVSQPLQRDLLEGQSIAIDFWHQPLHADEPATGHAALVIDDEIVWERFVEIPQNAEVYTDVIVLKRSFQIKSEVIFHLHNHGANSWVLGQITHLP